MLNFGGCLISEVYGIFNFWYNSTSANTYSEYQEKEKFGYKGKEIKAMFKEADKEIPNISTLYEKDPDAIYTSRLFTFKNLSKPINSSIISSSYLKEGENYEGIVPKLLLIKQLLFIKY